MVKFLVSYDLHDANAFEYQDLIDEIEKFTPSCHLQKSVWLISSDLERTEIVRHLIPYVSGDDKLFVINMSNEFHYFGSIGGNMSELYDTNPVSEDILRFRGTKLRNKSN